MIQFFLIKRVRHFLAFLMLFSLFFSQLVFYKTNGAEAVIKFEDLIMGCTNNETTLCYNFGSGSEVESTVRIGLADSLGPKETSAVPNYQSLLAKVGNKKQNSVRVYFPIPKSVKVDSMGLPDQPMLLEIRYQDTVKDPVQDPNQDPEDQELQTKNGRLVNRPVVRSFIDYSDPDLAVTVGRDNAWLKVGSLKGDNDKKWRILKIPFAKNNWQRIRAVNGSNFIFDILMPEIPQADLPLDYISLSAVNEDVITSYNDWLKESRRVIEAEFSDSTPAQALSSPFVWFTTPLSQPVYPATKPTSNSSPTGKINMIEAQNEIATSSFSIYAKNDLPNVNFGLNDLVSGSQVIPKENISLKKVVYDYKHWFDGYINTYGLVPDRVEKFSSIDLIKAQQSQQFYLYIRVPESAQGGRYETNIDISVDNQKQSIPISLEVMPFKLEDSAARSIVYHSPFLQQYSTDKNIVFQDFRDHGVEAINGFANYIFVKQGNLAVVDDEYAQFESELQYSINQGVVKKQAFYGKLQPVVEVMFKTLGLDGTTWQNLNDANFQASFRNFIKEIIARSKNKGVEELVLQVFDEPSKGETKEKMVGREMIDRLNPIIIEEGGKTWITYNRNCSDAVACSECGRTLSSIDSLTNYKVWKLKDLDTTNNKFSPTDYSYYTTYYSHMRNQVYNRFMNGLMTEKTGAKVVANYAYNDGFGDPYNDFDTNPLAATQNMGNYDYVLAYPSWTQGMISTTAWEGVREGVKDAKYIATLKYLINLYPHNPNSIKAKADLKNMITKIPNYWKTDYADKADKFGFADEIIKSISAQTDTAKAETDYAAFDKIRLDIINDIKAIYQNMLTLEADLVSGKSGEIITYTVTYANPTERWVTDVNISDVIPAGTEYVNGSASDEGVLTNGVINWKLRSLAPGHTFKATFKVKIL